MKILLLMLAVALPQSPRLPQAPPLPQQLALVCPTDCDCGCAVTGVCDCATKRVINATDTTKTTTEIPQVTTAQPTVQYFSYTPAYLPLHQVHSFPQNVPQVYSSQLSYSGSPTYYGSMAPGMGYSGYAAPAMSSFGGGGFGGGGFSRGGGSCGPGG